MSTRCKSVFDIPDVAPKQAHLHDRYIVVQADKASNDIVLVCKTHNINCLRQDFCLNTLEGNPTCTFTSLSKEESLRNDKLVLLFFRISTVDKD